jgi:hypothetical protein
MGVGKRYALRLISGSRVAANLLTQSGAPGPQLCPPCEIQPIHEKQIRPLAQLEPAQQCEVWEEAVRSADGKAVTYKHVKDTVKELTAPAAEPTLTRDSPIPGPRGERLLPPPLTLGCPSAGLWWPSAP